MSLCRDHLNSLLLLPSLSAVAEALLRLVYVKRGRSPRILVSPANRDGLSRICVHAILSRPFWSGRAVVAAFTQ